MLVLDNIETTDVFANALTLESKFGGRLVYVVANQSAVARFRPLVEIGGSDTAAYGPEVLLTPQSSFIDKISGVQFRSAVAGSPARIVAQLSEPGDILPASGTPFTGTLAASGDVSLAIPAVQVAPCTVALNIAAGAFPATPITGCAISFTIVGAQAEALFWGVADLDITAAVAGEIYLIDLELDSVILAGGIYADNGAAAANQRVSVPVISGAVPISAGAHTLRLLGDKFGASAGAAQVVNGNTVLSALIIDK